MPEEDLAKAGAMGVCKVNVATRISMALLEGTSERLAAKPGEKDFRKVFDLGMERIAAASAGRIKQIRMVAGIIRKQNPRALPLIALAGFGTLAVFVLVGLFTGDEEIGSPEGRAVIEAEARGALAELGDTKKLGYVPPLHVAFTVPPAAGSRAPKVKVDLSREVSELPVVPGTFAELESKLSSIVDKIATKDMLSAKPIARPAWHFATSRLTARGSKYPASAIRRRRSRSGCARWRSASCRSWRGACGA